MVKKKTIEVRTDIPYGNACAISVEEEKDSASVYFASSPEDGSQSLWFCFRIETRRMLKEIKLVLKHSYNMLMGNTNLQNILPVIKKDSGRWERMDNTYRFQKLPDGRYLVSWILKNPGRINDIALCYPYGIPELENLLKEAKGYWKKDIIGVSTENRPIIRLANDYSFSGCGKPGIYIIARQHSGETPGSWVLDGLLRYFMEVKEKNILVWAIPFSNIDGVEKGRYGKDYFPFDINRSWGRKPLRYETLVIQRDIARWLERCKPLAGMDFHAPGGAEGDGAYFPFRSKGRLPLHKKKEVQFMDAIAKSAKKHFAVDYIRKGEHAGNFENLTGLMFTSYFNYVLKLPALCIEVPYGISNGVILTDEDYRKIGKSIAIALIKETCEKAPD